jgi:3-hexulose-6-phosphate synthase
MKLQLALDTLTLEQCIILVDKIREHLDIIEVGTPFIIEEGMKPVREFKVRYPELEILADCKIMDAGEFEATAAFRAGADIVTVLGVSNNATVSGVVRAAKKYGKKVMVDLIEVQDIKKRAVELLELGVDYLCVHTAFDIQSENNNPLHELELLTSTINKNHTAVAGGVKLKTITQIASMKPEVVVVGGAICNAENPIEITKQIKGRMI